MKHSWRAICNLVFPIILGAAIYVLWRSPHLLVFVWLKHAGLIHVVAQFRSVASVVRPSIPQIVLYSLPDALWVYSFTAALAMIWGRDSPTSLRLIWLSVPTVIAAGAEVGQAIHWVPGTFDWSDMASYPIAGVLGGMLSIFTRRPHELNQSKDLHGIQ